VLEILVWVTGNGRGDSAGAEQENCLPEHHGAHLGHNERPAGSLRQRHHAESSAPDFANCRTWRQGNSRPRQRGILKASLGHERPEHHQGALLWQNALNHLRAMPTETCKVEVATGDAPDPVAHALARDFGVITRSRQR
jgi:hypothetical protein